MPPPTRNVVQKNMSAIVEMEHAELHNRTHLDRLSDGINKAVGSVPFALVHFTWFAVWLLINTGRVSAVSIFDPFPFSLLALLVSMEAVFLSVFVLMSQRRMMRQADKRAHLDLQVNLLAEQELTAILSLVQALCKKHGVDILSDEHVDDLVKETDVQGLASEIDEQLPER
jgi:uncharacterized membrane protein